MLAKINKNGDKLERYTTFWSKIFNEGNSVAVVDNVKVNETEVSLERLVYQANPDTAFEIFSSTSAWNSGIKECDRYYRCKRLFPYKKNFFDDYTWYILVFIGTILAVVFSPWGKNSLW